MAPHRKLKDQRSLQHQIHITKLEKEIKYAETDYEKAKIYDKFAENFLMPKELWIKRLKFVLKKEMDGYTEDFSRTLMDKKNVAEKIQVLLNAIQHLYYDREAINCKTIHLKMLKPSCHNGVLPGNADGMLVNKYFVNKAIDTFTYPNHLVRHNFMLYERYSSSPASKTLTEKAEKMEKLFGEIKAASGNLEKWIKAMAEANDIEFVKHNIEHKLGNNLTNKKLWRLYIDYLRTVDRNAMLHVYSKYCRYFLEDTKMKDEYQRETEQNDTVFVTWKNPFNFEAVAPVIIGLDDGVKRPVEKSWCHEIESFKRFKPLQCPKIDFNIAIQDWLLPSPIIRYIIDFANPTVYQKLQQSCKFFFFKKPIHYCYRFLFTDFNVQYVQFVETSAECSTSSISTFNHKSLYITTVLNFYDRMSETSLSEVIRDKIYQCDARYIHICDQKISEKEFKFMVGHGNVEKIELWNCEIKKIDGAVMMMEEILGMLPNIRSIILQNHMLLANNTLSKLQFLNKILKFYISFQSNLDPNDLCTFIKTNAAPYSKFEVCFHSTFDEAIATNIVEAVETLKKQWKPVDQVPFIFVDKSQLL